MDEAALRRSIRERFETRELPRRHPERTWAGMGRGQVCAVCDSMIGPETIELEAHGADDKIRYYHLTCYAILRDERDGMQD